MVGVQRSLSLANLRRNLAFVPKLWSARRRRDRACSTSCARVSWSAWAATPACRLCSRHDARKIPVVVVSYDRLPGRASRLAAKRAAACAVAFPDSPLPRATFTGAPVRQAVLDVDRDADRARARRRLGLPDDRFVVAVIGGSQGSGVLNAAVEALLDDAGRRSPAGDPPRVGERFLADRRPATDGSEGVLYQPIGYEPDMPAVYAAADLSIGRGGASTVHEVAATGIPAVLVPWAASAEDHQTANVAWLADAGAAVLLTEAELDSCRRWSPNFATTRTAGQRCRPTPTSSARPTARPIGRSDRVGGSSLTRRVSTPTAPLDLSSPRRLHVIGVGGPGMSAIALALAQMGHSVSGVDIRERQVLDRLRAAGVTVHIGHRRSNVLGCDAVTASTAIAADLNELDEARRLGITVLSRAGMLASICARPSRWASPAHTARPPRRRC